MENYEFSKVNTMLKEIEKYIKREDTYRAMRTVKELRSYVKACQVKKNKK